MVEQFMDLKIRIVEARGRLLAAIRAAECPILATSAFNEADAPDIAGRLAGILAHLGNTLLRVEDSPAGLRFDEVEA